MPPIVGKVAVVTGASSGIGAAIVEELVEQGMLVAGLARRVDRVEALAKSLTGKNGKLIAIKCDVTSEDEIKKAFAYVEKTLGTITVLVNNAGVLRIGFLTADGSIEDMKQTLATNVIGLITCTKEALQSMVKNKTEGTIININSIAGHHVLPFPGIHVYNSSKHAVTAFTQGIRNEITLLKANIRVTSVSPGAVESEMTDQIKPKDGGENVLDVLDLLPASDIADCVTFILKSPQRMNVSELTVMPLTESTLSEALVSTKMVAAAANMK